jgi:hypothetical protein
MTSSIRNDLFSLAGALAVAVALPLQAPAAEPGLLPPLHRHITLAPMVTANGDFNPYAVVVAPLSAGSIHKDDVLVTDFNRSLRTEDGAASISSSSSKALQ